jgi:hypothetical protein
MQRPPIDELVSVFHSTVAYQGLTTVAGAIGGMSIIDANLIGYGANTFVGFSIEIYYDDPTRIDVHSATAFNNLTGEITVDAAFKGGQVPAGVRYKVNVPSPNSSGMLTDIYNNLINLIASILVLNETGGTLTTDGTEQNIYINNAPAGVFEPLRVLIDFTNNTAAETIALKVYYRIKAGGNFILKDTITLIGAQSMPLKNVELEPNRFGVKVTLTRLVGNALDYDWEVLLRS